MSLAELLKLCTRQVRVLELQQQKEEYRQYVAGRKQALANLERLIHEWRSHSQSQKQGPLDNASILMAEVQGVIRYREAREAQLANYWICSKACAATVAYRNICSIENSNCVWCGESHFRRWLYQNSRLRNRNGCSFSKSHAKFLHGTRSRQHNQNSLAGRQCLLIQFAMRS